MSAKRVLITGASGLLGRQLVSEFVGKSWDVLGLAFSRATGRVFSVYAQTKVDDHLHF